MLRFDVWGRSEVSQIICYDLANFQDAVQRNRRYSDEFSGDLIEAYLVLAVAVASSGTTRHLD